MGKLQAFASGRNRELHLKPHVAFNEHGSIVTKWTEVQKRKGRKKETNLKYIIGKGNEKMENTIKKL